MSDPKYTIKFTLNPDEPFTVFVLEVGGFLPLCFTGARIILVDRNILSNASNILKDGGHKDNKANAWWFNFLNSPTFLLNPALSALEGSNQKVPAYNEFCYEFKKGKAILEKAFPKAQIIEYSEIHYQAGYALVKEATESYETDLNFLLAAAPLIATRNPAEKLQSIESDLFSLAKSYGLIRPTFAFIACLSCLYESGKAKSPSIGRQILKPKSSYNSRMAHNALMDLCALNFLVQANAKLGEKTGLCTADKGLLRFWCALRVQPGGCSTTAGFTFSLEFTPEMFQALNESEIMMLKQRVETHNF
jgi:hypothetical protein